MRPHRARVAVTPLRIVVVCTGLAVLLIAVSALAVVLGSSQLDISRALDTTLRPNFDRAIALERLQRTGLAALVGAGLSTVGVAFQALTRNPLADPFILGVSGGAALGAALSIALGAGALSVFGFTLGWVPLCAFLGAVLSLLGIYRLATVGGRMSPYRILLLGVVFNFFASAVIMYLKVMVAPERLQGMVYWLMGVLSLDTIGAAEISMCLVVSVIGVAYLIAVSMKLNVVSLGDEGALQLGVDLETLRRRVFVACSLVVGAAVSLSGMVGFVGLIIPHGLRLSLGADHRLLVPAAAFGGAVFLVVCDLVARLLFPALGSEAPIGAVTAVVGGPVFVWLLLRSQSAKSPGVQAL